MTVIPQDSILLQGTLRSNLDPLGFFSDGEILKVLEMVKFFSTPKQGEENTTNDDENYETSKLNTEEPT